MFAHYHIRHSPLRRSLFGPNINDNTTSSDTFNTILDTYIDIYSVSTSAMYKKYG